MPIKPLTPEQISAAIQAEADTLGHTKTDTVGILAKRFRCAPASLWRMMSDKTSETTGLPIGGIKGARRNALNDAVAALVAKHEKRAGK